MAIAECVYCGKPFCGRHGELGADYTNVCDRKACVTKVRDVEAHLEWKRRVEIANAVSVCAHEECEERMRHLCSRCQLMFCMTHISEHTVTNQQVRPPRREIVIMCVHCRSRRRVWD
ncbi:MAG: hypothetical protein WC211_11960 [Dehalococcoidia bacterium]